MAEVVAQIEQQCGQIDILVNAAGVSFAGDDTSQCNSEIWDETIAANLHGTFLGIRHVLPLMRRQDRGAGNAAAYSASKGGVLMLTKSAALYCARTHPGIRVNSISPGYTRTPLLTKWAETQPDAQAALSSLTESIPMKRLIGAEEVAGLAVFLASDDAAAITGSDFPIDGGYLAC